MDSPIWVTFLVALIAAAAQYLGATRPARAERDSAKEQLTLARQELRDAQEDRAIERINAAWEQCRSGDDRERRAGLRTLRAIVREPNTARSRLASNLLDEVFQEEIGIPLAEVLSEYHERGRLPEVDVSPADADTGDDEEEADDA